MAFDEATPLENPKRMNSSPPDTLNLLHAAHSISSDQLKDIIQAVEDKKGSLESNPRFISFHQPEKSTVSWSTVNPNQLSCSLSSQDPRGLCPQCFSVVDTTANFCSACGHLLKKNYRRL